MATARRLMTATAVWMLAAAAAAPQEALQIPPQVTPGGRIPLIVGESHVVRDVRSYDIANTKIVEAKPGEDGSLIINAKSPGVTTLLVRKRDMMGIISYQIEIGGGDIDQTYRLVKRALGAIVGLFIHLEGNVVVLEGVIQDRDDGRRIDHQQQMYGRLILDLTERAYLKDQMTALQEELAESEYRNIQTRVQVGESGKKVLVLRGTVYSERQRENLLNLAMQFFEKDRIVEHIAVDRPQIEVDVEVYAFDMSKARQIGSNDLLTQLSHLDSTGWSFVSGPRGVIGGRTVSRLTYPTLTFSAFETSIQALEDIGAVTNLSKQHASVRSGETAIVRNITQQKLKIQGAFDAKLESVDVGQTLEISPVVRENEAFETKVKITLSELVGEEQTRENVELAVASREYEGVFVSYENEMVVLGGGKRLTTSADESRTPLLGRVPGLNLFFNANSRRTDEQVTVYFMTLRAPSIERSDEPAFSATADETRRQVETTGKRRKERLDRKVKPSN